MEKIASEALAELEQFPGRLSKIAAGQRTKEQLLDLLIDSGRLQDLDQRTRDELLVFYVRQSSRLLSECAELKRTILTLKRGRKNA